jgi:Mn-containing catalase
VGRDRSSVLRCGRSQLQAAEPKPLGDVASVPAPDPSLYATYDGALGEPSGPALGTEAGFAGKIKDALT